MPAQTEPGCFDDPQTASIQLPDGGNAIGPYYTSDRCGFIAVQLTYVRYQTDARACVETPDGVTVSCRTWQYMPYPGWQKLDSGAASGTRYRLEFRTQPGETLSYEVVA
ncbi:hypothetical protein ACFV23_39960 [Streptomyces sp. NPDC059627]